MTVAGPGEIRILMRCDASRQIGSGHVMRCLTLARALAEGGARVSFACSAETLETVPALGASGFPVTVLAAPLDADEVVATGHHWGAIVVDHYGLDARHEAIFRQAAPVIMVLDDLADRPHDCDILLDQTVGRAPSDYDGLVAVTTEVLLGARYALLRPEFARARPDALAARSEGRPVSRIFVSLGMTDVGGVTAQAVEAALAAGLEAEIAVAVSSRAESMPRLRVLAAKDSRVVLYPDCDDVCGLVAASDMAIGAGGTTSWERCCLGLPTIMVVLAANQLTIADNLARRGAVELVTRLDPEAVTDALRRLAADPAARTAMSRAAGAVTDGAGVEMVLRCLFRQIRGAGR